LPELLDDCLGGSGVDCFGAGNGGALRVEVVVLPYRP